MRRNVAERDVVEPAIEANRHLGVLAFAGVGAGNAACQVHRFATRIVEDNLGQIFCMGGER